MFNRFLRHLSAPRQRHLKLFYLHIPKRPKLFFLHIPKTAGTSFVDALRPHFRKCRNYIEGLTPEKQKALGRYDFVSGHLDYDEMQALPYISEFQTAVVLREPFRRLVSHLRFMDRYRLPEYARPYSTFPDDLKSSVQKIAATDFACPDSLRRFFTQLNPWERRFYDNCQTRFLGGDRDTVETAIHHLDQFDFVGISENLEGFLAQILGMPISPPRSNTASSPRTIDLSDHRALDVLAPFIQSDLAICRYALAKLAQTPA